MTKIDLSGHRRREERLDAAVLAMHGPKVEGRPCNVVAGFEPQSGWPLMMEAQQAGLMRLWIDEYDGLYRVCLTGLGRARREAAE